MKRRASSGLCSAARRSPLRSWRSRRARSIALWVESTANDPQARQRAPAFRLAPREPGRIEGRRSCHDDEWDGVADRGDGSCARRKPARHTDLASAKGCRIARVGWLEVCGPGPRRPHFDLFRARLADKGYVEGKNLIIEQRFADCRYDRMPGLAADLVQVPVDVLFTMGTRAAVVAGAVKTTPLVVYSCDPFEHVTRLARPGGNLTGVTCMTTELSPKRLELLKELVPNVSRVMFLHDPEAAPNAFKMTQEAAPRLGISLQVAQVTAADELLPELAMIAKQRPDALFVYPDVVLSSHPRPQQLADFALKARLPTMHAFRFFVDACGLMSYGAAQSEIYASAAEQVAKSWMAPGRVICRCDRQRGSSWSSTTGLRRRSESQSRRRCCAPTK